MEASNLGYKVWVTAICMMTTSLKCISSMRLHRDLDISQKSPWHLAHWLLRETWRGPDDLPFAGPVEADETLVGEKAKSMHGKRRKEDERGRLAQQGGRGQKRLHEAVSHGAGELRPRRRRH